MKVDRDYLITLGDRWGRIGDGDVRVRRSDYCVGGWIVGYSGVG